MDDKMYKKPTLIDDVEKYLDFFPVGLVQFLTHITKDQKNMVNRWSNQLALIIEDVYTTRNFKYVAPLRFSQGLVKWSLIGSKAAHAIDSSSSACGSITTLLTFLNENAKDTINECFPENDVDIFADNTQKKDSSCQRRWNNTSECCNKCRFSAIEFSNRLSEGFFFESKTLAE